VLVQLNSLERKKAALWNTAINVDIRRTLSASFVVI
jgi:hypothetical protein